MPLKLTNILQVMSQRCDRTFLLFLALGTGSIFELFAVSQPRTWPQHCTHDSKTTLKCIFWISQMSRVCLEWYNVCRERNHCLKPTSPHVCPAALSQFFAGHTCVWSLLHGLGQLEHFVSFQPRQDWILNVFRLGRTLYPSVQTTDICEIMKRYNPLLENRHKSYVGFFFSTLKVQCVRCRGDLLA